LIIYYSRKEEKSVMKPFEPVDVHSISPERRHIAWIFHTHIEKAIEELGFGYEVEVGGRFDTTPIRISIEITTQDGKIP
jgi:hypothetical protein